MSSLVERIKASFENPRVDPWFPELTPELTTLAWDNLSREIGVTPHNYGTARVLSRNISAPREIITSLGTCPFPVKEATTIAIEAVHPEWAGPYSKAGVSFYSLNEIVNTGVRTCLDDAFVIVNHVPSLMRTVATLVRSLHAVRPEDTDYDVSFSEPTVPFSIFVSVPDGRDTNNPLRVAEAIVHEAMHLQLTLIEYVSCLVNSDDGKYFSPWRRERRRAGSILHGVYVFYVIHCFLGRLISIGSCPQSWLRHIRRRQREIELQVNEMRPFQNCAELTALGSILVRRCVEDLAHS